MLPAKAYQHNRLGCPTDAPEDSLHCAPL